VFGLYGIEEFLVYPLPYQLLIRNLDVDPNSIVVMLDFSSHFWNSGRNVLAAPQQIPIAGSINERMAIIAALVPKLLCKTTTLIAATILVLQNISLA
jgi:hypothetical protein